MSNGEVMASEAERVEELRAAALWVLERHGTWKPCGSRRLQMLTANVNNLLILYRTPFQKLHEPSERVKYMAAMRGKSRRTRRYSLDIWHGKKVFSIEWDDAEQVAVRLSRRGDWKKRLLAARREAG